MHNKIKIIFLIFFLFINTIFTNNLKVDQYYCTACDTHYFNNLLNLIGSIHKTNFENLKEIAVFDIGLTQEEKKKLKTIQKLKICRLELTHPDLLKRFTTVPGKTVPGWYAFKPVAIKQALDIFPYVLWIDSGSTVLNPLNDLFKYIQQNGYFLSTVGDNVTNSKFDHGVNWQTKKTLLEKFKINTPSREWILTQEAVNASCIGVSRSNIDDFILPLYNLTKDLTNFEDDGTTPNGFGTARHDQAILALLAYTKGLKILRLDYTQESPMYLNVDNNEILFYMTWNKSHVNDKTGIYCSRHDLSNFNHYLSYIKYK